MTEKIYVAEAALNRKIACLNSFASLEMDSSRNGLLWKWTPLEMDFSGNGLLWKWIIDCKRYRFLLIARVPGVHYEAHTK